MSIIKLTLMITLIILDILYAMGYNDDVISNLTIMNLSLLWLMSEIKILTLEKMK